MCVCRQHKHQRSSTLGCSSACIELCCCLVDNFLCSEDFQMCNISACFFVYEVWCQVWVWMKPLLFSWSDSVSICQLAVSVRHIHQQSLPASVNACAVAGICRPRNKGNMTNLYRGFHSSNHILLTITYTVSYSINLSQFCRSLCVTPDLVSNRNFTYIFK